MRIVIAGAGEVGRHLAGRLSRKGVDIVMIDRDAAALAAAEEGLDVRVMAGDATWRSVLRRAEVDGAQAVVAVTGSDTANMVVAALGRSLGAHTSVARVDTPGFHDTLTGSEQGVLGVDHIFCTSRLTGAKLLTLVARASAHAMYAFAAGALHVALMRVTARHAIVGRTPNTLPLEPGALLGGVVRDAFLRPAREVPRVEPGDLLLLAGPPSPLAGSLSALEGRRDKQRVVVIGGSDTGALVAGTLAGRGVRVDLVERNAQRCFELAAELPDVNVLRGDATDLPFLQDIRLGEAEGVVAVTNAEEVNLLATLLVQQMDRPPGVPAPHTWAAVHRPGYAELSRRAGVEGTVSSFEVLSRAVLESIVASGLVHRVDLAGLAWSVVHLRLPDPVVEGLVLDDVPLPAGMVPLGVVHGCHAVVPRSGLPLRGGADLVLACPTREIEAAVRCVRGLARGGRQP